MLPSSRRKAYLAAIDPGVLNQLQHCWRFWARPDQLAPETNWQIWAIIAGRGYGKTRTGAEWVQETATGQTPLDGGTYRRFALVAETAGDARDVMVEGESGILAVAPPGFRPKYEPSKRRLTWPNGAVATTFCAMEPDQLRGPQFDAAWSDEMAKWRNMEATWDMLQFSLRLGEDPRQIVTTTPRPRKLLKQILDSPHTHVTRGSTYDNRENLAGTFFDTIIKRYEGTRLGRQELNAEILEDVLGALWTRSAIEACRVDEVPEFTRIVVGVDPAVTRTGDEVGIVAAATDKDENFYVLDDASQGGLSPQGWATKVVDLYNDLSADRIVAEVNQGGDLVESLIRQVDGSSGMNRISYKSVRATRGKVVRAEPIAALYEQGRVFHVGTFPELEDQMCAFTNDFDKNTAGYSPDRVDALVWALTELSTGRGDFHSAVIT